MRGIEKHGVGKWAKILKDPEFDVVVRYILLFVSNIYILTIFLKLHCRHNIAMKDKFKTLKKNIPKQLIQGPKKRCKYSEEEDDA